MGNFARWLEGRNLNITKQFSQLIQVFQDFKLAQELRKELLSFKTSHNFS